MKIFFTLIILCFSVLITHAQVKTIVFLEKSLLENVKLINDNKKATHVKKFMPFDVQKMLNEDAKNEDIDVLFRFGKGFDTNITLSEENWTKVENGRLWSMEFESTGAYSINFVFNDFYLPEGAELYIANREETMLYGPVTSKQNTKNGFFLTDLVQGDNVTLYLFEPANKQGQARLTIKRVVHAYKNLFSELYGGFGTALSCHNNIDNFPAWDLESDAVALVLLSSGSEHCSGSLLMTANQSFRPFFLTAFHCIDINKDNSLSATEISNAENWMFKFQYKQSTYTSNPFTSGITYNGADFKAAWKNTDFALMEMKESPVGDASFSWLGWDRSGDNATSGTGIHHPAGDVMKISFDNHPISPNQDIIEWGKGKGNIIIISPIDSHWDVGFDNGTAEGGSSGSPLFDQNKRVIGQLHGGFNGCAPITKYYGIFNLSWTGGGTNDTRLSNWLDPTGSGVITTNTARSPVIIGPDRICTTANTYTMTNLPANATVTWSCNRTWVTLQSNGNSVLVTVNNNSAGLITLTAQVAVNGTTITVSKPSIPVGKPTVLLEESTTSLAYRAPWEYTVLSGYGNYRYTGTLTVNDNSDLTTSYTWSKVLVQITPPIYWSASGRSVTVRSKASGTSVILKCTASNACGSFSQEYTFVTGTSSYITSFYPNPASDILNIEIDAQASALDQVTDAPSIKTTPSYDLRLYDGQGNILRNAKAKGGSVQFNVSGLPNGVYYLHIYDGVNAKPEIQQIVVEH